MGPDRGNLAVKILVENVHHGFGRQPVGKRGKAAQVRQPDRGMHRLGVAAPDLAAENALAGTIADIGIEKNRSLATMVCDLDEAGQRWHQRSQTDQLFVAESAWLL